MKLWPHQQRALDEFMEAVAAGEKSICITSPTGGGKTEIMRQIILWALSRHEQVLVLTHRKLLREQISDVLKTRGVDHGIRAAGVKGDIKKDVQVSSIQTEHSRVYRKKHWMLHPADIVLIDEIHVQKGDTAQRIAQDYLKAGAIVVGFTATVVGIDHMANRLIVAGTMHELRECGALTIAHTYAPDEPDTKYLKPAADGDFTVASKRKVMMTHSISGRVYEWLLKLNPDLRPTLLFGPDVAGSKYFAERFYRMGIRAAHIDGTDLWLDGKSYKTSPTGRAEIIAGSEDGSIPIICNRFVMREGVDMPWLFCLCLCTIFGKVSSYIQAGGRVLRNHPDIENVIVLDFGGNWWRHQSLNHEREWKLGDTNRLVSGLREENIRSGTEPEPIVCPACARPRLAKKSSWADNQLCPYCGYRMSRRSRKVVQLDGTLKERHDSVYPPRRRRLTPTTERDWESTYHRAKRASMTFRQAETLFAKEHYWFYPPRDLALMPTRVKDWFEKVKDVPFDQLTPKGNGR